MTETSSTKAIRSAEELATAVQIMARLRAPDGCPWDREQDFDSIKKHTLDETYEVFDAIERRAWPELCDELGDLLLQVLFYAQMADEAGYFAMPDVIATLNAKLIRRHPHIFGADEERTTETAQVLKRWDAIKAEEKKMKLDAGGADVAERSLLADVPRTMPAMLEATKLGSCAAKVGFDWPDAAPVFLKLDEEIHELHAELAPGPETSHARVQDELGDVLFTLMNLARHLKVDPESALRGANAKFRRRFAEVERSAGGAAMLAGETSEELDVRWRAAKETTSQAAVAMPGEARS
jgi:ATP diphosphatase